MNKYDQLTALFQDEEFKKVANECKTMEDFHALFTSKGVEISMDETVELISTIGEMQTKEQSDELTEESLEDVAGGFVLTGTAAVLACAGIGVASIGVAAGAAYVAYQGFRWANKHKCKK